MSKFRLFPARKPSGAARGRYSQCRGGHADSFYRSRMSSDPKTIAVGTSFNTRTSGRWRCRGSFSAVVGRRSTLLPKGIYRAGRNVRSRCSQIECHLGPIERFSRTPPSRHSEISKRQHVVHSAAKTPAAHAPVATEMHAKPNKSEGLLLLAKGRKHLLAGELDSAKEIAVRVYSMNLGLTPSRMEILPSNFTATTSEHSHVSRSPPPFLSSGSPSGRTSHFDPGFE